MLTAVTSDNMVPLRHPSRRTRAWSNSPHFRPDVRRQRLDIHTDELSALFSVCSEHEFSERLEYDLLFKWFLDLNSIDHIFDCSVLSKNKQRYLSGKYFSVDLN